MLDNDTDIDGGLLVITGVTQPGRGTVSFNDSAIVYTPGGNYAGPETFTYTVSDGKGATTIATVTVSVTAVQAAPTATDDTATVSEDGRNEPTLRVTISDDGSRLVSVAGTTLTLHLFAVATSA